MNTEGAEMPFRRKDDSRTAGSGGLYSGFGTNEAGAEGGIIWPETRI